MKIITLTINPALDKSAKVAEMTPFDKLECHSIDYHPGGGGINISRVLERLGVKSECIFTSGGKTGEHLTQLLTEEHLTPHTLEISSWTRENFSVVDEKTGLQYRFGMPTTPFQLEEIRPIEKIIFSQLSKGDLFVISGSLPPGLPINYYAQLIQKANQIGVKVIVDTSGAAFHEALKQKLFLIKPNLKELGKLAGKEFNSSQEQEDFALSLVASEKVAYVVVSLGKDGAFVASKEGITYVKAPKIEVKSTIGAGDSMVAGLIYGIKNNYSSKDVLRWGVACGVSATQSEGSDLAHPKIIKNILQKI